MNFQKRFIHQFFYMLGIFLFGISLASADIPNAKILFSVPYYATMSPSDIFTPVAHSKGRTFLVWIDLKNRPWVTMHFNNVVTTVPLDANPDYTSFPDGHHLFSMGIDKKGYLHITGDMHYYPSGPNGNAYLPVRYQSQQIMYWVSNQPFTTAGGFTFAGGAKSTRAISGTGFLLGRFFNDKNGELYYSTMARAYDNGTFLQGMGGLGFYHYNVDSQTWDVIGDYATNPANPPGTKYYKVLFWENSGLAGGAWFQNYQATLKFDNNNRLHFAISANVDPRLSVNSRVLYASSNDRGLTWTRANGSVIPGLPLRGVDSSPNVADVVIDTGGVTGLPVYADVVADQGGHPAVFTDVWRRWNGSAWIADISASGKTFGARGLLGPDGKLTFNEVDTIYMRRSNTFTANSAAYQVQALLPTSNLHLFQCISDLGLQQSGSLFGLGTNDSNLQQLQVAQIDFRSNPLPSPWSDTDIGTSIMYGGAADYQGTSILLRASGAGIAGNADNLHYLYQPMSGNKTIIAHIAAQDSVRGWATTGIMMRETLDPNASLAMIGVSYNSGTQIISRNGKNTMATNTNVAVTPAWVKLARAGNIFTSYYSNDGINWTQAGVPQTIPMAQTIYVGVSIWAFADIIHTATVDNVQVS
jgi:hypothetical protein